jgi:hypothetical protein
LKKHLKSTCIPASPATQGFPPRLTKNTKTCRHRPSPQKAHVVAAQVAEKVHEWETTGRRPGGKIFFPARTPTGTIDSPKGDRHTTDASPRARQKRRRPLARPSQITCSEDAQ